MNVLEKSGFLWGNSVREEKETQNDFQRDGSACFFCKEWLISRNWDRQPAFIFDKDLDMPSSYGMIPTNMHLDVEWVHER
jgi:hypothetical protein